MKTIPLSQLKQAGNLWHRAFEVGRLVNGVAVEVPDDFPWEPMQPVPAAPPALAAKISSLFGGATTVDEALQNARLAICGACASNVSGNCAQCQTCGGRPVAHKVKWSYERCPDEKW